MSDVGNFGQRPFAHTPPTGYRSLCSKTLATPAPAGVVNPRRHFECLTYTGDGAASGRKVTGLEFQPDFVWIKNRTQSYDHHLYDSIRGVGNYLESNDTTVETNGTHMDGFLTNGFSVGNGVSSQRTNANSIPYVAWCWKAGGAAVSNSDGTITSSVSANTEAGFSIVSYTGNETNDATVGHGLGKSPDMVIIKDRVSNSAGNNWYVFHSSLASGHYLKLNQMSATAAVSGTSNGGVGSVTSTTFNFIQGTSGNNKNVNENGDTFIAYCFASIPGYSKFGSYTGNGSTDGTYVHLGFKPAFIITKQTNSAGSWFIFDNKRNGSNETEPYSMTNANNLEATDLGWDFLSHGFKHRNSYSATNGSNNTFIYMAFAEQPSGTMFGLDANAR